MELNGNVVETNGDLLEKLGFVAAELFTMGEGAINSLRTQVVTAIERNKQLDSGRKSSLIAKVTSDCDRAIRRRAGIPATTSGTAASRPVALAA